MYFLPIKSTVILSLDSSIVFQPIGKVVTFISCVLLPSGNLCTPRGTNAG